MGKKKKKNTPQDTHAIIRDQIVEALENLPEDARFTIPWRQLTAPINASTGKHYNGLNVLNLSLVALSRGYIEGGWLTFRQAKALGGSVKKGEKSTRAIYYSNIVKEKEGGEEERYSILKQFALFHTSQCEGLEQEKLQTPQEVSGEVVHIEHPELDALLKRCPVELQVGERAYYSPGEDFIVMPDVERFHHSNDWWLTYLHELTHATGHASRLNRLKHARFGSRDYAFEELVAELGAAHLGLRFGLSTSHESAMEFDQEHLTQHAAYLESWIQLLKDDKRAIFDAWALSLQATDWIMALAPSNEEGGEAR